jgi:hypothetical protein
MPVAGTRRGLSHALRRVVFGSGVTSNAAMNPEMRKMVEDELRDHVGVRFDFEVRQTHGRITLISDHKSRFVTVSKSASDYRAMRNIRGDVRRALKEIANG